MITRRRSNLLIAALVLSAFALIALLNQSFFHGEIAELKSLTIPKDELCSDEWGPISCEADYEDVKEVAEEGPTAVTSLSQTNIRTGPARVIYPPGYEQFSLEKPVEDKAKAKLEKVTPGPLTNNASLAKQLEDWVPYIAQEPINKVIWQTWHSDPGSLSIPFASWRDRHKDKDSYKRFFVSDAETEPLMARLSRDLPVLKETYDMLPARVLQLDFLRYAALFKDGGVYTDFDTLCYKPVEEWLKLCGDEKHTPSFAVGVDLDLQGDLNFDQVDNRQLLLTDYVWIARKGHPILRDLLKDITLQSPQMLRDLNPRNTSDVRAWTGRVRFTDTVIRYVQNQIKGFSAQRLQGLKGAKMFGDVCVFEITAFGSGQRKFANSPETDQSNKHILSKHYFMRSWEK